MALLSALPHTQHTPYMFFHRVLTGVANKRVHWVSQSMLDLLTSYLMIMVTFRPARQGTHGNERGHLSSSLALALEINVATRGMTHMGMSREMSNCNAFKDHCHTGWTCLSDVGQPMIDAK